MGRNEKVTVFEGQYRFLSNFYIEADGTHVEGEFQSLKCAKFEDMHLFRGLSPKQAKAMGRKVELRKDWEEVKDEIMLECLRKKFQDHDGLACMLVGTGNMELEEGNVRHDTYWGMCYGTGPKCGVGGHHKYGQNVLGRLLMMVRKEIA